MIEKENPVSPEAEQDDNLVQDIAPNTPEKPADANEMEDAGLAPEVAAEDASDELELLNSKLEEAQQESAKFYELALRVQADAENEKKRAARRLDQERKYALQELVKSLLEVKDNLERSLQEQENDETSYKNMREGIGLTLKSFVQVFKQSGVEELNPQGEPFNPEFHEAVKIVSDSRYPANTVIEVMQKGYCLHDRLLRAAMVVVAKEGPENTDSKA